MSQFRGYAQKSSVQSNLIKTPDVSSKFLQEGRRYLQQWKEVSAKEDANRERFLSKLENNFKKEEQERNQATKLRQAFAGTFKQALDQNHKVLLNNAAELKSAGKERLQALAPFSDLIKQGLTKGIEGYKDGRIAYGRNLALRYDLDSTDVKHLKNLDSQIEDYEGKNNELINELRSKGASWDRIKNIRNLSGWSLKGLREGEAVKAGEKYEGYYWSKYNIPLELPDGTTMSLGAAWSNGDIVRFQQLQDLLSNQYINQPGVGHISENLISEHIQKKVALVNGRGIATLRQQISKDFQKAEDSKFQDILATKFKTGGVRAMFDMTALQAGKTNFIGAEANRHRATVALLKTGVLDERFLNELVKYEMKPRDGGKPVLWYERNDKKFNEYKAAYTEFVRERAAVLDTQRVKRISEEKNEAELIRTDILNNWENIPNKKEFLLAEYTKNNKNESARSMLLELYGLTSGSAMNDKIGEPFLWDMLNNKTLTRSDVIRMQLSPQKTNVWLKRADEASPFNFTSDENKIVTSQASTIIEDILKQHGSEGKNVSSSTLAKMRVKRELGQYFKMAIIDGKSREDALIWAKGQIDKDIADGAYSISQRKIITKDGREITVQSPEFKDFSAGVDTSREPYPYSNITSKDVQANPDILSTQAVFPMKMIEDYYKGLAHNKHEYPPAVLHFVTKFGINSDGTLKYTPREALEAQARFLGIDIPENLDTIEESNSSRIPPEYHRHLYSTHATKEGTLGILLYNNVIQEHPNTSTSKKELVKNYKGPENGNKFSPSALEIFNAMGGGQ